MRAFHLAWYHREDEGSPDSAALGASAAFPDWMDPWRVQIMEVNR